jgi:periplasmic protein CpxP/Spy
MSTRISSKWTIAIAATAALLLAAPAAALAAGGFHGGGRHGAGMEGGRMEGGMLLRLADKLNLSDLQRTQVKMVLDQAKQALAPLRDQLKSARQAYRTSQGPGAAFDENAVRTEARKEAPIREDMAVVRARAHAQALSVLTPQQRDQLQQLRADWKQKHGNGPAGASGPDGESDD